VRKASILLIHPPVAKPSEPPAGIARLAGALKSHNVPCTVIDANIEGLHHLVRTLPEPGDTWSRRAYRHLDKHLQAIRSIQTYARPDVYRRAVSDLNRLLFLAGKEKHTRPGLADYHDEQLAPVRSNDLIHAASRPECNPYFDYFHDRVLPAVEDAQATLVGISLNYLSQALCAFALVGLLRRQLRNIRIVLGGGLVTSWQRRSQWMQRLEGWVDRVVSGPGEAALLEMAGHRPQKRYFLPDYGDLFQNKYLSPGPVVPFSASDGCWWRRCAFCPEQAEGRRFRPLPHSEALDQLQTLVRRIQPMAVHLLDNALSPALLKALAAKPLQRPWYGFARLVPPLDDPVFCSALAASGCAMLQIGLESGDQQVLDSLDKGIDLKTASKILRNLKQAGIAAYVYLLFGTPPENPRSAVKTLDFAVEHHEQIGFLNLALFNLPLDGSEFQNLRRRTFYPADLALYSDFAHPKGWDRSAARRFIEKQFKKHPVIQTIIRRDPPVFTSNHAAFFTSRFLLREVLRFPSTSR
jgi:hypothetical protein